MKKRLDSNGGKASISKALTETSILHETPTIARGRAGLKDGKRGIGQECSPHLHPRPVKDVGGRCISLRKHAHAFPDTLRGINKGNK